MREAIMRRFLIILSLLQLLFTLPQAQATDNRGLETEVQLGMEEILTLWRDGRLEELYGRTSGGKLTKEAFVKRFADASLKPTCCWDKLQGVTVTVQTSSKATLHGTIGLETATGGETKTKAFKLSKNGNVWRINQSDLVSLAGAPHKKKKRSVLKKTP
jgi:hypothetical protein